MQGWVWLLPAHETTHYDWRGEAYAWTTVHLSEEEPLWTLSWNPNWPSEKRGHTLQIYHSQGRHIGFWGRWSPGQIAHEIESLWTQEGFQPTVFQPAADILGSFLARRWKKRFSLEILSPFPPASDKIASLNLPKIEEIVPLRRTIALLVHREDPAESAHLAELLALENYTVWIVGSPRWITPFRQASYRFPTRIHLKTGLPWLQMAVYLAQASLLLCADPNCLEAPFLQTGKPWIVPHTHPHASTASAAFSSPTELPTLVTRLLATPG